MDIKEYTCGNDNCCQYKINRKEPLYQRYNRTPMTSRKKAGAFIVDEKKRLVLMVQSRGYKWGPPKGGLNVDESNIDGAIREIMEETGLLFSAEFLETCDVYKVKNHAVFYYINFNKIPVEVQNTTFNVDGVENINDASGIGWFGVDCLRTTFVPGGVLNLNQYGTFLLNLFEN